MEGKMKENCGPSVGVHISEREKMVIYKKYDFDFNFNFN